MARQRGLYRLFLVVLTAVAAGLSGCSSLPGTSGNAARSLVPADPVRAQVVFTAMQMVGVPYRWGGSTPEGFDCSGLVQYAYSNAGLRLPRTAAAQMEASLPLTLEKAEAGDLLFFRNGSRTSHVAIYLGQGRFVHAPTGGKTVSLDSFGNAYWRMRFARAGRMATSG